MFQNGKCSALLLGSVGNGSLRAPVCMADTACVKQV
jgi:hypothetical protein